MPRPTANRMAPFVVATSSLLLSSGLLITLWLWTSALERELASDADVDMDQSAVIAWWVGEAGLRWSLISAGGSFCGVLGLVTRKSKLHRVFAVTTATDLAVTILLTLTLSLLTFAPSLSGPFGSFLCSSAFASDYSTSSASLLSGRSERTWSTWSNGIEFVLWGVEACEEGWQTAMVLVLIGCVVTLALRIYGTWVTWEVNADLREGELRDAGEGWVDVGGMEEVEFGGGEQKTPLLLEEALGRPKPSSSSSRRLSFSSSNHDRRSNTLPLPYALEVHKRSRSNTIAFGQSNKRRPQLLFVPVMFDAHGQPLCQPSSPTFAVPHYASPPRSRTSICSSTLSSSPSRSTRRPASLDGRSSSSSPPRPSDPLAFTAEPVDMNFPPRSPTCQSTCTATGDERTSRRLRSKSENDHLFTSPVIA
ncbi:cation/H+ exchanger [Rhodotorula toruloides]|uniref:Cation/H+ exchanger n=1 Tax=Rhodotorula toruloides TaxID=5286 RepID=A0A511K7M6_RHOTO|nr:cation/H+ exchanger [Rhodotorula toruloides]